MHRSFLFLLTAVALLAQAPPNPTGFAGTVVKYDDASVTLNGRDGKTVVVQMTPGWTVSRPRSANAQSVKPGSFVASANTVIAEGSGRATELRVLEPGYRPEEGTHGMADSTNMMTHGTVESVTATAAGVELKVTYPGGSRRLLVPENAPVTISDPLERSALKPGVAVSGVTRKDADGVARAGRLVVAK